MTKATKRGILAVVTIIVLLALGVGLGAVVGDALGIRTEPATQMEPAAPTEPDAAPAVAPPRFTTVDTPVGPRYDAALDSLLEATADASYDAVDTSLTVVAGDGDEDDET